MIGSNINGFNDQYYKKGGRLFSKRTFSVVLVLLFGTSLTVTPVHSTGSMISVVPTVTTVAVGEDFTVNFTAASVTDLFGWQIVFKYNTTVLNCTGAWIPDDSVFAGHHFLSQTPVNDTDAKDGLGCILFYAILFGSDRVDVTNGILFKANFTVIAAGSSPLTIATANNPANLNYDKFYSILLDVNVDEMPFTEESGVVVTGLGWVLTITVGQGGATVPVPGLYVYQQNGTGTVLALPTLGYEFDHWELDGANVGSSNPYSLSMTNDHGLEAEFRVHVPRTWTVDKTGPADFHTISDAINSPGVVYGDVVLIKLGVYPEHVVLKPGLKVIGEDREATIIDGSGQGVAVTLSNNSYVGNLTVQNGDTGISSIFNPNMNLDLVSGAPYLFPCLNNTIENMIVRNNVVGGVFLGGSNGNLLKGNVILNDSLFGLYIVESGNNDVTGNMVHGSEHGIIFGAGADNNFLRDNRMVDNTYNFGVALSIDSLFSLLTSRNFNDIDSSNTVDGKPVYCWFHEHDKQVPPDAGYVWLLESHNITVQGLNLSHNLEGILSVSSNNIVIAGNTVEGNLNGIYLLDSANTTLTGNNVVRNQYGLYVGYDSSFTVLKKNSMMDNNLNFGTDFGWMGGNPRTFLTGVLGASIDSSNTVNGKPIYFWVNQHGKTVPSDAGCVILVNSSDIVLENLKLSNNVENILLLGVSNTTIRNCEITNSSTGINLAYAWMSLSYPVQYLINFNISISHSYFRFNSRGIFFLASNSTLSNNRFFENLLGIQIKGDNNLIENNVVTNNTLYVTHYDLANQTLLAYLNYEFPRPSLYQLNEMSIYQTGDTSAGGITILGQNNTVFGNTFAHNEVGAYEESQLLGTPSPTLNVYYHNNFISNIHGQMLIAYPMFIAYPPDAYNNSYPIGGNYWSDYLGSDAYAGTYQNESGSDGIGDMPYFVGEFIVARQTFPTIQAVMDYYPLVRPYFPLSLCDLDGNGVVDIRDMSVVARAFGSSPDNPRWNAFTDLNYNGKVDLFDVASVAKAFGKHIR